MNAWYAVQCKPRREFVAETNLINQGYRVYLPLVATKRRCDGRWVDTVEPLFPRYLFLAIGSERQSLAPVRSTFGVCGLVRFGGEPAVIPESVVESLRARQDPDTGACAGSSPFTSGARVEFRAGPLMGLEGVIELEASQERVYVLLELLGKLNKVPVARDWLLPAA